MARTMPADNSMEVGLNQEATHSSGSVASGAEPEDGGNAMKDVLDIPWADKKTFLVDLVAITALGCFIGLVSVPYSWIVDKVPEWWLENTGPEGLFDKADNMKFLSGSWKWIPICWGASTLVGVLKVCVGLDAYPSFITELKHQKVEPWVSAKVLLCCIASLCAGATLGLEAGLGATGAAFGHVLAEIMMKAWPSVLAPDDGEMLLRRRTYILCGIAGAFGSILPAPFVSAVLVAEVASAGTERHAPQGDFMAGRKLPKKVLTYLVPAASFAFVVRYVIDPAPILKHPGYLVAYDNMSAVYALGLGAIAAVIGLIFLLIGAVVKKVLVKLTKAVEGAERSRPRKAARQILLCSIGGLVTGVGMYMFPLVFSSGRSAMGPTMANAKFLTLGDLAGTALMKCITFWVGSHCGLVGGLFFPAMYIGLLSGEVCARVLNISHDITVPVMLGAVPASFLTAPMTNLALPVGMFVMGPLHTVPIFIGVVTSNTLLVGSGFLEKLLSR